MEAKKRIDLPKVVAETTASELTTKLVALLLPLLSGLVSALVPQVRDRILPVLPKPLLAILVGVSLSANLALFFYVARLRRTRRQLIEKSNTKRTFIKKFTVKWDEHLEPHCPVCLSELAPVVHPTTGLANIGFFRCVTCKHGYRLINEATDNALTLPEAKELLSSDNPRTIEKPSFDRTKLSRALNDLESLKTNLPRYDIEEKFVTSFHHVLTDLKNEAGYDLTVLSIPPSEIKHHETHHSRSPRIGRRIGGEPAHTTYSKERFCNRSVFLIALDRAISRLKLELSNP